MSTPSRRVSRLFSPEQMQRAIHLDVEGFKGRPPVMGGTSVDGRWTGVVFVDQAPELVSAARVKGLDVATLDGYLESLLDRLEKEDRVLAAFSRREWDLLVERGLGDRLGESRYLDTRRLGLERRSREFPDADRAIKARRGRIRRRGGWVGGRGNRLIDLARLMGMEIPANYGLGRTTSRLRSVMSQLSTRGDYHRLTSVAKTKWTSLLIHNQADCEWSTALAGGVSDKRSRSQETPVA